MYEPVVRPMHSPPHPGEVLKEYLGDLTLADAAGRLLVDRSTLHRILIGEEKISTDIAQRLGATFDTSSELWTGMQSQYDLYYADKVSRLGIIHA